MTTTAAKLIMPVEHKLTPDLPLIRAPARSLRVCLVKNYNRSYVFQPAFGLGYLAAVLRQDGHEVAILDGLKNRMSPGQFEQHLRRYDDCVGQHDDLGAPYSPRGRPAPITATVFACSKEARSAARRC